MNFKLKMNASGQVLANLMRKRYDTNTNAIDLYDNTCNGQREVGYGGFGYI